MNNSQKGGKILQPESLLRDVEFDQEVLGPWSAPAEFHAAPRNGTFAPGWLGDSSATQAIQQGGNNLFRTAFTVPTGVTSATLYICGLGYSRATIDGQPVSPNYLTTAPWTNNERRSGFSSFDVTKLLGTGQSVLGVSLGAGWRDLSVFARKDSGDAVGDKTWRTVAAELHVVLGSGEEKVLASTGQGKWDMAAGPVIYDSVYNGETYDARKELPGWDTPAGLNSHPEAWTPADVLKDAPRGGLTAWSAPPVLLDRVIPPVAITEPTPGVFVVDFGVNVAGVCQLSNIDLPAGANVTLKHAEILQHAHLPGYPNPNPKMIYADNLRTAKATDVYISDGSVGTLLPRFTYHGFRYVQVTGLKTLSAKDIELHHIHSANPVRSNVTFTSATLTQLQRMAVGAQRSNMMTVQTGCDQRDERLGWMGDANLSGDSIGLNFDVWAFFKSILQVMKDETGPDGSGVDVAPEVRYGNRPGDISWTAAYPTVTRVLYEVNHDVATAKTHYPDLQLQLSSVATQCKNKADAGCPTLYGDWCPPPVVPGSGQGPKPPKPYTSAASYIGEVDDVKTLAWALGDNATGYKLQAERTRLAETFNAGFLGSNNTYGNGVMSTYSLPLHLGIVPDTAKTAVEQGFLGSVTAAKGHSTCGIIGMKYLFSALAGIGRKDTALQILEQVDYPSLGYMAYNTLEPATENLWELPDGPFEGTGMNSRNHHMFSSYSLYLVQGVAGVDLGGPGGREVTFVPAGALGVRGARATVELSHGTVGLEWERAGGLQCAKAAATDPLVLGCGTGGGTIAEVHFAGHGRPRGTCGALGVTDGCHVDLAGAVATQCVGQVTCTVVLPPTVAEGLGDCTDATPGDPLWSHVQFSCTEPESVTATATVPIGSSGTIALPTGGISRPSITLNAESLLDVRGWSKSSAGTVAVERHAARVALGSGVHTVRIASTSTGPTRAVATVAPGRQSVGLGCDEDGAVISRVVFADHAAPASGRVGERPTLSGCGGGHTWVHAVEKSCLGKARCTVDAPLSSCSDAPTVDYVCAVPLPPRAAAL